MKIKVPLAATILAVSALAAGAQMGMRASGQEGKAAMERAKVGNATADDKTGY